MKICMITSYPPKQSGIANYSKNLCEELEKKEKIKIFKWNYEGRINALLSPFKNLTRLKNALKNYDVVHIQYVLGEQMFFFLPLLFVLSCFKSIKKAKIIITSHEDHTNLKLKWLFLMFHDVFYSCADEIWVHTKFHRNILSKRIQKKTRVIPFGIVAFNNEVSFSKTSFSNKPKNNTILLAGFINPWKGHDIAINAVNIIRKKIPNIKLILVGKAHNKKYTLYIQNLIKNLNLEYNIILKTGFIPQKEFEKLFKESRILLIPYRRTTMSAVASDTISYAKPAIFSDIPALKEFTENKAEYFKNGDYKDLAEKIINLLKNQKKQKDIEDTFKVIRTEKSWKNTAKKHYEMYQELLGKLT